MSLPNSFKLSLRFDSFTKYTYSQIRPKNINNFMTATFSHLRIALSKSFLVYTVSICWSLKIYNFWKTILSFIKIIRQKDDSGRRLERINYKTFPVSSLGNLFLARWVSEHRWFISTNQNTRNSIITSEILLIVISKINKNFNNLIFWWLL